MKSLKESLFDNNIKKKTVPELLAYVLKKFFGDDIALCSDHQGSHVWYELNPETMDIKDVKNLNDRIVNYCKKIDGLDVKEDKIPLFTHPNAYVIGNDDYWMIVTSDKKFRNIRVSEKFYNLELLPHDQSGVTKRGWTQWQRW